MKKQKTAQKQYRQKYQKIDNGKKRVANTKQSKQKERKKNKQITTITKQGLKSTITNNREKKKKG